MTGQQRSDQLFRATLLGGLNTFVSQNGLKPESFSDLINLIPQHEGTLNSIGGIKPLIHLQGLQILQIHFTYDIRQNVIVQTSNGVYVFNEDEIFGRTYTPSLTPITITDEENMAKAIIVHTTASNTDSGGTVTQNTWVTGILTAILSQLNPDGSAAAFVTALAANVFTLEAGTYRFNGWSMASDNTANNRFACRLYNVTTGAAAWVGLENENGPVEVNSASQRNARCVFGGDLTIAVPTQFRLEIMSSVTRAVYGQGRAMDQDANITLAREVYRWIEILKTA